jgi:hypothetical protein
MPRPHLATNPTPARPAGPGKKRNQRRQEMGKKTCGGSRKRIRGHRKTHHTRSRGSRRGRSFRAGLGAFRTVHGRHRPLRDAPVAVAVAARARATRPAPRVPSPSSQARAGAPGARGSSGSGLWVFFLCLPLATGPIYG